MKPEPKRREARLVFTDDAGLAIRRTRFSTICHKSAVETLDTYSHRWPDPERRTRQAVDAVLRRRASAGEKAVP